MPRKSWPRALFAFLAATMLAPIGAREVGAAEERLSGTAVEIDHTTSTLLLRAGPWRMSPEENMAALRIRIALTPETRVLVLEHPVSVRANPRSVVRVSSETEALRPGVFATVVVTRTGDRFVAEQVEVFTDPLGANPTPPRAPSNLTVRPN